MAEAFQVRITTTGPLFDQATIAKFQPIINRGLLDLAIFEGANKVKEQLWGPRTKEAYLASTPSQRHGAYTRNLRNHIWASLRGNNEARVDAGSSMKGKNIVYADKIEEMYGMFENTKKDLNRNATRLGDKYIGDPIIELLGGQP